MSFLRTTKFWTIIGGLFAILSFVYIFYMDQWVRPKSLAAGLVSVSTLLNEKVRNDGRSLQVLFGSEPVKYFAIARVSVKNTGGSPIVLSDFEGRLVFEFKNVRKIYFVDLRDHTPKNLNPVITYSNKSIGIEPLLLNSGDAFDIEVGIDIESESQIPLMETNARIAGVNEISVLDLTSVSENEKKDVPFLLIIPLLLLTSAIIYLMTLTPTPRLPDQYAGIFDQLTKRSHDLERENSELRAKNFSLQQQQIALTRGSEKT